MIIIRAFILCFALGSCAVTPSFRPLPLDAKDVITSNRIFIHLPNDSIEADINRWNFPEAGLVEILLEASINYYKQSRADDDISALKKEVDVSLFYHEISSVISSSLGEINSVSSVVSHVGNDDVDESFFKFYDESADDAVIYVKFELALTPGYDALQIRADAKLIPKSEVLKGMQQRIYGQQKAKPKRTVEDFVRHSLYSNKIVYSSKMIQKFETSSAALEYCKRDNAKLIKSGFTEGAKIIVKLLEDDLGKKGVKFRSTDPIKPPSVETYSVSLNGKNVTIHRNSNGSLTAISLL